MVKIRVNIFKVQKGGGKMLAALAVQPNTSHETFNKLAELKKRAAIRRNRQDLRHTPNENDNLLVNENASLMACVQYASIKK